VAFRTFGNSHATLVGLIVDWWITAAPGSRWALEGGLSFGYHPRGIGGGICDAILGEGDAARGLAEVARGVVEVEGTRYDETLLKIGRFFSSTSVDLQGLEFGVFLAYAYFPQGRGPKRAIAPLSLEAFIERGRVVTKENPGKHLAILALDKRWERQRSGLRARNEYAMGSPERIRGALLMNGDLISSDLLITRDGSDQGIANA
jgi:hypothetical protein